MIRGPAFSCARGASTGVRIAKARSKLYNGFSPRPGGRAIRRIGSSRRPSAPRAAPETAEVVAVYAKELVRLIDQLLEIHGPKRGAIERLAQLWRTARPAVCKLDESATPEAIAILREVRDALPDARGSLAPRIKEIRALVERDNTNFGLGGRLVTAWGERRAAARAIAVARLIVRAGADFDVAQRTTACSRSTTC